MSNQTWVVIPAAGVGKRMKADRPKQYLELEGKTVIEHTLACFSHHSAISGIVVVLSSEDPYWPDLDLHSEAPLHRAEGGKERCHSVLNGLDVVAQYADDDDWVLVHDAARPCLMREDLDNLFDILHEDKVGGILAVPVRDTMKRENDAGRIDHTVERRRLWHALTPQMFRLGILRHALTQAMQNDFQVTDEASAMEYIGLAPRLVEGRISNIKITHPDDLALASYYLQSTSLV
jgi:2-C-methyl-D-erythritol 4-phosphate cytidylyltransferase